MVRRDNLLFMVVMLYFPKYPVFNKNYEICKEIRNWGPQEKYLQTAPEEAQKLDLLVKAFKIPISFLRLRFF